MTTTVRLSLFVIAASLAAIAYVQLNRGGYLEAMLYSPCDRLAMHQGPENRQIIGRLAEECAATERAR